MKIPDTTDDLSQNCVIADTKYAPELSFSVVKSEFAYSKCNCMTEDLTLSRGNREG